MKRANGSGDRSSGCAGAHVVGVYERDHDLVDAVAPYLAGVISDGGSAVVIATPEHRAALAAALDACGAPRAALERAGRYRALDARATLDRFMIDGRPDAAAFREVVGGLFETAANAGRPVRVFGEMVGVLWSEDDRTGALALEACWNDLADEYAFELFCGYSLAQLESAGDLAAAKAVCERHSAIAPLPLRMPAVAGDAPDAFTRLFLASPTAPHDARAFVRFVLASWGESRLDGEAEIVASELATNAVRHAQSPFRLSLTRRDSSIRIAVRDASSAAPEHQAESQSALGGRGVRLVAALSCSWGTDSESDGKTVWAELPRFS